MEMSTRHFHFLSKLFFCLYTFSCKNTDHNGNDHIRECISKRNIHIHQNTVKYKTDHPDYTIHNIQRYFQAVLSLQNEEIRNLDCDHRCKDRADQIEEICDVVFNMGEVTDAKRAQVEDIVKRKTNVSAENVIITPIVVGEVDTE